MKRHTVTHELTEDEKREVLLRPLQEAIELYKAGEMDEPTLMLMNLQTVDALSRHGVRPLQPGAAEAPGVTNHQPPAGPEGASGTGH